MSRRGMISPSLRSSLGIFDFAMRSETCKCNVVAQQ
ncbi:predicted protein [Sclerotinia sclerotiorum 1980 UF-70]|uniref:Uncharacterized protein n=1 Tax=Sclerotinia sclerotiorum (strain ATCC 18683 / 1980 / Ss-1) TaxID=665079 RepID=A7EFP4_SCLS1|nr:predicted protein [Sclerotinia sclerotiorum 1980 UF-70]EDO01660.1 predicted protein [Sclerotinia sclerotiorum 1980 UF-70]